MVDVGGRASSIAHPKSKSTIRQSESVNHQSPITIVNRQSAVANLHSIRSVSPKFADINPLAGDHDALDGADGGDIPNGIVAEHHEIRLEPRTKRA